MIGKSACPDRDLVTTVLAGGRARRMGGRDKSLTMLAGRPLLDHVLARLEPQVGRIVINANGDPGRFAGRGLPVVADSIDDFAGPLAGVLAGLDWVAANVPEAGWMLSVPADTPFLPRDLAARLQAALESNAPELVCAASGGRVHHVVTLWPLAQREALRRALLDEGLRKVDHWTARFRVGLVDFTATPVDPFFNVNTPDDIADAERLLAGCR
ncbi:MAG: molybdenum cofactor guanylyltransferase MobA [Dongiaceae bacterium]